MTERRPNGQTVEIGSLRIRVDHAAIAELSDAGLGRRIADQLPADARTAAVIADLTALIRRAVS